MPITPSPAVLRACEILGHLVRHPSDSFSVSELARVLDVPRATCDAILQALAVGHLVRRDDADRCYVLAPGAIALGEAARVANPLLLAAGAEAEAVARELGVCAAVTVRDGITTQVAEVFDHAPVFAARARIGQEIALVPPFGAVFVAWSDDEVEAWLGRSGVELDRKELSRYRRAIARIRERGYSVSVFPSRRDGMPEAVAALADRTSGAPRERLLQEMMHSTYLAVDVEDDALVRVSQISAPVFDRDGAVVTSLMVAGPEQEIDAAELRVLAERLVRAAEAATRAAGGRPGVPALAAGTR